MIEMAESGATARGELVSEDMLPGRLHPHGYDLPEGLSFERWQSIGVALQTMQESVNWWAGDWLKYGLEHFGQDAFQAVKEIVAGITGHGQSALRQALWVAERFPPDTRVTGVPWTAHRAVAALPPLERQPLLEEVRDEGLSTRDLIDRVEIRKARTNGHTATVEPEPVADPDPPLPSAPPTNEVEAFLLIAELAGFIQDQVMTKVVLIDGKATRHDRHCAFTAEHPTCARKCALARSLIERAELLG